MFRTIIALLLTIFALAACSSSPSADVTADAPATDGLYTSVENGNGIYLEAVVEDGQIEIDWYFEGDDSDLYWKGSFEATNNRVISTGDTSAMDASVMGSGSDTKEFWFEGDELCFELTALGHTQTIRMEGDHVYTREQLVQLRDMAQSLHFFDDAAHWQSEIDRLDSQKKASS